VRTSAVKRSHGIVLPVRRGENKLLQAAQPQVAVYIYEKSGQGFNNDGRPDSDPDDAALARKRTIELFEANGAA
jgi:dienelactone hydrolase